MKRMRLLMILFAVALGSLSVTAPVLAQEKPFTFVPSACMFEGIELGFTTLTGEMQGFECGYVIVPERHADPEGSTIRLPVAIRKATGPDAQPDPLFLAQGGPGGDAFSVYALLAPTSPMAENRDIVVFNQRGTKYAEPDLSCVETQEILPQVLIATAEEGEVLYEEALAACRERLASEGIDLSAYNSLENAADVSAIAKALGYDAYNFYGVSYGTLLGLHLMRQNPEGLRSVILDSVVPTNLNFIPATPTSENRIYDEIFANCESDPVCREAYPDLEARYFALVEKLDAEPVTLTIKDPDTGERYPALLDGRGLRGLMYQLFYVPRMAAVFPKIVADMEEGDFRYLEAMWPVFAFDDSISEGMYYSVVCAEDADFIPSEIPLADLRPQIGADVVDELQSYLDACAMWDVDRLPASVDEPVTSDIPTLLLSGRFDPITPPSFAQTAADSLPNDYNLVDPLASHGVAFLSPCVNGIVREFLDDPTTRPSAACLDQQAQPGAVPPDAITVPLMGEVNSLDRNIIVQFGLAGLTMLLLASALVLWPIIYLGRAVMDKQVERSPEGKRIRWVSRGFAVLFTVLAGLFAIGLLGFIVAALADRTLATALAVPASAAPLFYVPLFLAVLALAMVICAVLLWRTKDAGSTAGKAFYSLLAAAAVGFVVLIATQNLLLPVN